MKTKTIKLYEYGELSKEAKEKALKNYQASSFDVYGVQVHLDNELEELLKKHGIRATRTLEGYETNYAKIHFSLSRSQGDGVMFEGVFSFPSAGAKVGGQWKRYEVTVKHTGRYCHSNSKTVEIASDDGLGHYDEDEYQELYSEFEQVYQSICKELEKSGYAYIEEVESEEYFIEECNANEWTFREDGTLENE